MSTTEVYDKILDELDRGQGIQLARMIFNALTMAPDGLSRRALVRIIFARSAGSNIGSDTADRKIRKVISEMRARHIPIVSTSGKPGYRLDDSDAARKEMMLEMIRRRDSLDKQIRAASQMWKIPVIYTDPVKGEQMRLI